MGLLDQGRMPDGNGSLIGDGLEQLDILAFLLARPC